MGGPEKILDGVSRESGPEGGVEDLDRVDAPWVGMLDKEGLQPPAEASVLGLEGGPGICDSG